MLELYVSKNTPLQLPPPHLIYLKEKSIPFDLKFINPNSISNQFKKIDGTLHLPIMMNNGNTIDLFQLACTRHDYFNETQKEEILVWFNTIKKVK